jgi:hypothetical protein
MTTLRMALVGVGHQADIELVHTDDDPPSLVLLLPNDHPQVAAWLAALADGVQALGADFSVAWCGLQADGRTVQLPPAPADQ